MNLLKYKNLINIDKLLSIILTSLAFFFIFILSKWVFIEADWGAVLENLHLFIYGRYPNDSYWRINSWFTYLLILMLSTIFLFNKKIYTRYISVGWILTIPIGTFLLAGGFIWQPVRTTLWGGLSLTIYLTLSSAFLSFPLGVLLGLGRQSNLIIIKKLSAIYIDGMRAIPLIAVLFFGQLLIPLFLPVEIEFNRVIRAIFSFSLFLSAYIAEDIRGGLQSIPSHQKETAEVLGLNKLQLIEFILLPQAIRIALPALANQAIGLLQNTTLMAILGLVELLGISRSILANPEFIGRNLEIYAWLALIYWITCTCIALLFRRIEKLFNIYLYSN